MTTTITDDPTLARIPAQRIAAVIRDWIASGEDRHVSHVARQAGVSPRRIDTILRGEQQHVTFGFADRVLCALDLVEEWHISLADIYEMS